LLRVTSGRGKHEHRHRNRGERTEQDRELARVEWLLGRLRDDVFESDAGHGDAQV
jgi:hypothetical protein